MCGATGLNLLMHKSPLSKHLSYNQADCELKKSRCSWHSAQYSKCALLLSSMLPSNTNGRNSEVQELDFVMFKNIHWFVITIIEIVVLLPILFSQFNESNSNQPTAVHLHV